jgi:uncharacterized repeat protein (TIGR04076 family)
MATCKITVLKKIINRELVDEFCSLDLAEQCLGCPHFFVGEEYLVENHNEIPLGFCSWAWADIQKDVMAVMFGASFPWIKQNGVSISCCTDGLMPVIFKIEKINSESLE